MGGFLWRGWRRVIQSLTLVALTDEPGRKASFLMHSAAGRRAEASLRTSLGKHFTRWWALGQAAPSSCEDH